MRGSKAALQYLAARQQRLIAGLPRRTAAELAEGRKKVLDELADALKLDDAERSRILAQSTAQMPTPWQHPFFYSLVEELVQALQVQVRVTFKLQAHAADRFATLPTIGTLPSGHLNALTLRVPDTQEWLVALNDSLFILLNLASKVFVSAFPGGELKHHAESDLAERLDRATKKSLDAQPSVVEMFWDMLSAAVVHGNPGAAPVWVLNPEAVREHAMQVCTGAELFVVAHEVAHALLGHLDGDTVKAAIGPDEQQATSGNTDCEVLLRGWEQEYQADRLAVLLAVPTAATQLGLPAFEAFAGIPLWFATVDVVHRAVSLLEHGDERALVHDTHPPPSRRADRVRLAAADVFTEGDGLSRALALASAVDVCTNELWSRVRPRFIELREKGTKPASIWSRTLQHGSSVRRLPPYMDEETCRGVRTMVLGMIALDGEEQAEAARVCADMASGVALCLIDDLAHEKSAIASFARTTIEQLMPQEATSTPYMVGLLRAYGRYVPLNRLPIAGFFKALEDAVREHAKRVAMTPRPLSKPKGAFARMLGWIRQRVGKAPR